MLIADYEGPDYGGWTPTGGAFGDHPWRPTDDKPFQYGGNRFILSQEGCSLAASVFRDGLPAMGAHTGTLTSPDFMEGRS